MTIQQKKQNGEFSRLMLSLAKQEYEEFEQDPAKYRETKLSVWWACHGLKPDSDWCAIWIEHLMYKAANGMGIITPITGSPSAKGTMNQIRKIKKWKGKDFEEVKPGSILVWHRGDQESWRGHIGIAVEVREKSKVILTLEGNVGKKIAHKLRKWDDPQLIGSGYLD